MIRLKLTGLLLIAFCGGILAQELSLDSAFVQYYYPNGQVSSEGYLKNGKPDGFWRNYHVTGILKSEGKRTNYLLDSIWNFYNQRGELVQSISYQLGDKNGFSLNFQYDNPNNPKAYAGVRAVFCLS